MSDYERADYEDGLMREYGAKFTTTLEEHRRATENAPTISLNEIRTTSSTGGQKGVKPERFDLIPVEALEALARHYGKGAEKYEGHQWRKGYEWSKSFAAMMRHAWKFWRGEDIDPETGSPHIICVAWHAFCLYTFSQDFPQHDDRYKKGK